MQSQSSQFEPVTLAELLTAEQLLARLPVLPLKNKQALWRAVRLGLIPSVRIGHRYYFNPAQIEQWLMNGGSREVI